MTTKLTAEQLQKITETPFDVMVDTLAKPGQAIKDTLSFIKFLNLLQICTKVIDKGNELDTIKKAVIYNKDATALPQFFLPSSQKLAEAHDSLTPEQLHLLHMAVGLAGEAGEMLEQVVRHILGEALDEENVVEEAGDATFYVVGLLNGVKKSLGEALQANKLKLLGKRYASGAYSDQQAQDRADKPAGQ